MIQIILFRLKSLVSLNISDCVNISERGIRGLCERCRSLETLTMRGCDKLTEKALLHMADASTNTASTVALCDSLKA